MPIRRYVAPGESFSPEVLSAMSNAFAAATESLGIAGDEMKRRTLAACIIRIAREEGVVDAATLRDSALARWAIISKPPARD
jgi:hypothetical protein